MDNEEECFGCGGNMDKLHEQVEENIKNHDWHVTGVMPDHEHDAPGFTYSTGLARHDLPEIIVTGLPMKVACHFINQIGNEMMDGKKFEMGKSYNKYTKDFPMTFIEVSQKEIDERMNVTSVHIDGKFKAIQLIWTDTNGKFPWQEGFEEKFFKLQPLLGAVPK